LGHSDMALLAFVVIIVAGLATGNFLASIFEFHGNTEMWVELGWFVLTLSGAALAGNWVGRRHFTVTITDRGPYVKGRCIDLSQAGARALGFAGLAPVSVVPVMSD